MKALVYTGAETLAYREAADPAPAEADVRSGLKDLEDDLATLARSWDQLPAGAHVLLPDDCMPTRTNVMNGGSSPILSLNNLLVFTM